MITSWSKVGTCGCTVHRKYRKLASLKSTDETPWQGSKAMDSQMSGNVIISVVNTDKSLWSLWKKLTQPSKYMCSPSHVACLTAMSIRLIHADESNVDDHATLFHTIGKIVNVTYHRAKIWSVKMDGYIHQMQMFRCSSRKVSTIDITLIGFWDLTNIYITVVPNGCRVQIDLR